MGYLLVMFIWAEVKQPTVFERIWSCSVDLEVGAYDEGFKNKKGFSYSLHIKFTSECAHFFSIVELSLLFGCNREMVWDTSPVCVVCISQPGFPSVSCVCRKALQSLPHLQRCLWHKGAEHSVPASFILKTLLLKPNLINELCVVSDKLCTGFIDWEGF